MFCCGGLFGVLVCCHYLMDEMLIHFSLVFDRWMTTPMPPSAPMDGPVVTGCTTSIFSPCSGTCYTILATRRPPYTMVVCTISLVLGTARSMCTTDPTMTAWFTTARGDDLDDTLERAAHQALMEFCECHLPVLKGIALTLLPIRNEGNAVWSKHVDAVGDPELPTHHACWALTAHYS
jgi:hypothetical protein